MEQVAAFCRRWDMLPRGGLVLCAVSGGRDSMALLPANSIAYQFNVKPGTYSMVSTLKDQGY